MNDSSNFRIVWSLRCNFVLLRSPVPRHVGPAFWGFGNNNTKLSIIVQGQSYTAYIISIWKLVVFKDTITNNNIGFLDSESLRFWTFFVVRYYRN
jgi:hypothetical protein